MAVIGACLRIGCSPQVGDATAAINQPRATAQATTAVWTDNPIERGCLPRLREPQRPLRHRHELQRILKQPVLLPALVVYRAGRPVNQEFYMAEHIVAVFETETDATAAARSLEARGYPLPLSANTRTMPVGKSSP
jgi:hypothetical protein